MAYLRLIYNPADNISFLRIINRPKRGIGAGTLGKVQDFAEAEGLNLYDAALKSKENPALSGTYAKRVLHFTEIIEELRAEQDEIALARLTEKLLDKSGYRHNLEDKKTAEAENRLENIEELFSVINEYMKNSDNNTLAGFLEEVTLMADIDSMDEEQSVLTLMTIHSAKGLEFRVVFITCLEQTLFPSIRTTGDNANDIDEERRLFYVALTRAKDLVFLTNCKSRFMYGRYMDNLESQFLEEIELEYLDKRGPNHARNFMRERVKSKTSHPRFNNYSYKKDDKVIKVSDKVNHKVFGKGVVVEVKGDLVKIAFSVPHGIKTLVKDHPSFKVER